MTLISKDIQKAVEILNSNELVSIPTETVYGLAGNIFSETAIKKIFEMKQRPLFNPLIVHLHDIHQLPTIVRHIPKKAQQLADAFWPGPLTLILPKQDTIPDLVTAGKDTVAVRIPNHKTTLALLKNLDFPLAAPSANPFGNISPTKAEHVRNYFEGKLAMVLDGGACKNGIESTIVGFVDEEPVVYRLGSIAREDLEAVVGPLQVKNKKEHAPDAPGMLSRHYAPETHTFLVENVRDFIAMHTDKNIGLLLFDTAIEDYHVKHQEVLSVKGDLKEATSKLYAALHYLDTLDLDMIVCQKFPNHDLGNSINDRLERATKRK